MSNINYIIYESFKDHFKKHWKKYAAGVSAAALAGGIAHHNKSKKMSLGKKLAIGAKITVGTAGLGLAAHQGYHAYQIHKNNNNILNGYKNKNPIDTLNSTLHHSSKLLPFVRELVTRHTENQMNNYSAKKDK